MATENDPFDESDLVVEAALEAIDAVNAQDPIQVSVDGEQRPREAVHAERMTHWLSVLDPDATEAQRLAARANHLRRWTMPRTDYPEGRAGYLRWRSEQGRRQAAEAAELLADHGVSTDTIERVQTMIAKVGRAGDPQVQTHEDALCLVFLEQQLDAVTARLGEPRTVEVLRKTLRKMSDRAIVIASSMPLSERGHRLLEAASSDA